MNQRKKRLSLVRLLRNGALIGILTLVLLELVLRCLRPFSEEVRRVVAAPTLTQWENRFVDRFDDGKFIYHGLLETHPRLGWISRPNQSVVVNGQRYTTNRQGMRSLHDYRHEPDKYNVLIVGDSFTFGDEADDSFVWPNLLQQKDERLNVLNFAVTAYGTDQMYLLLEQEIDKYQPDLVIVALQWENLERSMLEFRDFAKPRFTLNRDGGLTLRNTPIAPPKEVFRRLKEKQNSREAPLLFINAWHNLGRRETYAPSQWMRLNAAIFREMARTSKEARAEMLLVYLLDPGEMRSRTPYPHQLFCETQMRSLGAEFLNLADHFHLGVNFYIRDGHYQPVEARVVSDAVYDKLLTLRSWQAKWAAP